MYKREFFPVQLKTNAGILKRHAEGNFQTFYEHI
jgi:hypothetical protein